MRKSLRAKAFAMVMTAALLLTALTVIVSSTVHSNTMDIKYKEFTMSLAESEALYVEEDQMNLYGQRVFAIYNAYCEAHDGEAPDMEAMSEEEQEEYLNSFAEVYEMEGYAQMQGYLQELLAVNDAKYMYINLWDVERGTVIYLMDGSVEDATPVGWIEYIEQENLKKIRGGDYSIEPFITNYPEYGWLCTATATIYTADHQEVAHAYVDISMDEVKAACAKFTWNIGLMMLVIMSVLTIPMLMIFNRMMVSPIKLISKAAQSFVTNRDANKKNTFGTLKIKRKDEIGQLKDSLQQMEQEIITYIKNITEITAERERVGAELHVATQIQADMLPSIFPAFPGKDEFDIFASMAPAKEVGGDFYDFFLVDEDHLAMVMADVSGKGVPAALFMVIAKTLIKNRAQSGGTPAEILADVNNLLCEGNKAQLFVTVWIGILTISTGKGVAANAGHEDPVIRRAGGDFELIKYRHSPAVATMEGLRFREHEFEIFPGDTLFVYTDGVPEATNANDELYSTARMLSALNAHKGENLRILLQAVREDINAFVGTAPQFDDITMLGFEYYGPGGKKHE